MHTAAWMLAIAVIFLGFRLHELQSRHEQLLTGISEFSRVSELTLKLLSKPECIEPLPEELVDEIWTPVEVQ